MAEDKISTILQGTKRVPRRSEPTLRVVDFSHMPATMLVTTLLRRLWRLVPPELQDISEEFGNRMRHIRNEIDEDHPDEWYDDDTWIQRTSLDMLDPVFGTSGIAQGEKQLNALGTAWRQEIYGLYVHVFADAHSILSAEYPNCGRFEEPKYQILKLDFSLDGTTSMTHEFETDCFIYPIWVDPNCQLNFTTAEHEVALSPQGKSWTYALWLYGGVPLTITIAGSSSDARNDGLAAVFAIGICEKRPLVQMQLHPNPEYSQDTEGEWTTLDEAGQPAGFWPEADCFARAIFLKAGDTLDRVTFDNHSPGQQVQVPDHPSDALNSDAGSGPYQFLQDEKSFRVLVVESSDSSDDLQTRLVPVNLDEAPSYEALSYTWGDPSDKTVLNCNGHLVQIPKNLESALKRMRYKDSPRCIWADSVCINQSDLAERGQQVSIMRSIYQQAHQVLVWLGEDSSDHATMAFGAACDIVESWMPRGEKLKFSRYTNALNPIYGDELDLLRQRIRLDRWRALKEMFELPYFQRVWVIQELALSRTATVFWGEHYIAWELIGVCSTWLLTRGWTINIGEQISAAYNACLIYVLPLAQYSGISRFSKLDLSAVLGMMIDRFKSTDTRDRIYALLGMPFSGNDPDRALLITPDYSEDICSVYTKAARRMLEVDQHLRLLSAIQHGPEVDTSYPSWVPRWDRVPYAEPIALRDEIGYYSNAGELFEPTAQTFSTDGRRLILRGLEVAKVGKVSVEFTSTNLDVEPWEYGSDRAAFLSMLAELGDEGKDLRTSWNFKQEKFQLPGIEDPAKQAKDKTKAAVASGFPGHYGQRASVEFHDGEKSVLDHLGEFLLYWRERSSWDPSKLEKGLSLDAQAGVEITMSTLNLFPGRRIFYYNDGKFGLGPSAIQPGDLIVVLFGGIVPYILRPLGGDEYLFVGESFIPGLMQGEAVEEAGLFEEGRYQRYKRGELRIHMVKEGGPDPRFSRKTGEHGIKNFILC